MKKLYIIPFLLGMLIAYTGCDELDEDAIYPEKFSKILTLNKTGVQEIPLYTTLPTSTFELAIMKSGTSPETTAEAYLRPMTQEELNAYCEDRGLNVVTIPESYYKLSEQKFSFGSGERYKEAVISLITEKYSELPENEMCVIPLILDSENDSVNAMRNIILIQPKRIVPVIKFEKTGIQGYPAFSGISTFKLPVTLNISSPEDFTCKIKIDETLAENFPILKGGYTLKDDGTLTFPKGETRQELEITVNVDEIQWSNQMKAHVLPLTIGDISTDIFVFNETDKQIFGIPRKYPLTADMLQCTVESGNDGSLANLLDGDINTYFSTNPSNTAVYHEIWVNMPQPVSKFMFSYTNRNDDNAESNTVAFLNVKFWTTQWEGKLLTYDKNNLPSRRGATYISEIHASTTPATFLGFESNGGWNNNLYFGWSEFSIYVYE